MYQEEWRVGADRTESSPNAMLQLNHFHCTFILGKDISNCHSLAGETSSRNPRCKRVFCIGTLDGLCTPFRFSTHCHCLPASSSFGPIVNCSGLCSAPASTLDNYNYFQPSAAAYLGLKTWLQSNIGQIFSLSPLIFFQQNVRPRQAPVRKTHKSIGCYYYQQSSRCYRNSRGSFLSNYLWCHVWLSLLVIFVSYRRSTSIRGLAVYPVQAADLGNHLDFTIRALWLDI